MLTRVCLETADGRFVAYQAVPTFVTAPPPVLLWGVRVFVFHETYADEYGLPAHRYRETFYYCVTGLEYAMYREHVVDPLLRKDVRQTLSDGIIKDATGGG